VKFVKSLAKKFPPNSKILVNTCGWIEGEGKDLLLMILKE